MNNGEKSEQVRDWASVPLPNDKVVLDGVFLVMRHTGCLVVGVGQWGLGVSYLMPYMYKKGLYEGKAMRFDSKAHAEAFVRGCYGLPVGDKLEERYIVLNGLPNFSDDPVWSDERKHISDGDGCGPLPGSFT